MADYTPEQLAEMQATLSEATKKAADEAAAAKVAYLKPLNDFLATKEYQTVFAALENLQSVYNVDKNFSVHITALVEIFPRLAQVLAANQDNMITVTPNVVAPEATTTTTATK